MIEETTTKSLIGRLAETISDYSAERRKTRLARADVLSPHRSLLPRVLPSPGNIVFSMFLVGMLLVANRTGALAAFMPASPQSSTSSIAYQGRLASSGGAPLTGIYPMVFRLYGQQAGSAALWEEVWTGPNSVRVSDGLFNVMLGSLTPVPGSVTASGATLWLGITIGSDSEMAPRVQLGWTPYSAYAQNVANDSITGDKIANGTIKSEDLAPGTIPPGVPVGTVISWWRTNASTPLPSGEWMIADGSKVTDSASPLYNQNLPNLTDKFVMGVSAANIGAAGGTNALDLTHQHSIPAHTHDVSGSTSEVDGLWDGGHWTQAGDPRRMAANTYINSWYYRHNHAVNLTTSAWGGNTSVTSLVVDNRPAYFGLIYLVRVK